MNYYNEFDPKAAAWLRELIAAGLIPAGIVDTRSITEIQPHELKDFTQCHFFAGIAGWSLALQLAGWPSTRPVWTGSCPCQPFSSAGKQLGTADERHLWPVFFNLIRECRPESVFGEQVASAIGKGWLDGVSSDLEAAGYACGAAVLGAHSVGSPHIRQRLFWVADATGGQRQQPIRAQGHDIQRPADNGATGGLADAAGERSGSRRTEREGQQRAASHGGACSGLADADGQQAVTSNAGGLHAEPRGSSGLVNPDRAGPQPWHAAPEADRHGRAAVADGGDCWMDHPDTGRLIKQEAALRAGGDRFVGAGSWNSFDLIPCADGKARRIEPGLAPLAHGVPARVVRLRGYGNAIVPQVAAEFVGAFLDTQNWRN